MLFHFKTDNYVPVVGVATFVQNLLKRPVLNEYDAQAEQRFYDSLVRNLRRFAKQGDDRIYEKEFCELMRTFDTEHSMEFTDE